MNIIKISHIIINTREEKCMKKLLTGLFIAMLTLTITPAMNTQAKAKIKLNKTSIYLQKGKTFTLKVKGTKKKAKWSSNKKTIATVTKKGKVTAQKTGTAVITAKIGKKKYKCKVKVWQKTTKKPTNTNTNTIPNPIGTRTNPADPRTGITLDAEGGRVYFKLTEILKGEDAENRLLQMNQSLEEIKQGEYENPGTTLVLFVYDVQAINGYASCSLNGLDIINSYGLYDETCSHNIKNIESFYLSGDYEPMTPVNLYLYTGASSKMYEALWIPNGMTSFSNIVYKKDSTHYWVKYQF